LAMDASGDRTVEVRDRDGVLLTGVIACCVDTGEVIHPATDEAGRYRLPLIHETAYHPAPLNIRYAGNLRQHAAHDGDTNPQRPLAAQ